MLVNKNISVGRYTIYVYLPGPTYTEHYIDHNIGVIVYIVYFS